MCKVDTGSYSYRYPCYQYLGNKLLTQQLNLIKTNKDKIIAESNRELETFKKFQIAAQANPNLTYKEFCENINNK